MKFVDGVSLRPAGLGRLARYLRRSCLELTSCIALRDCLVARVVFHGHLTWSNKLELEHELAGGGVSDGGGLGRRRHRGGGAAAQLATHAISHVLNTGMLLWSLLLLWRCHYRAHTYKVPRYKHIYSWPSKTTRSTLRLHFFYFSQ